MDLRRLYRAHIIRTAPASRHRCQAVDQVTMLRLLDRLLRVRRLVPSRIFRVSARRTDYGRPSGPVGGNQYQNMGPVHYEPQRPQKNEPYFKYSDCSGKRKALCIGINYTGTKAALRGCHNDARNVQSFLCRQYGFKQEDIVVLLDSPSSSARQQPTRANIVRRRALRLRSFI